MKRDHVGFAVFLVLLLLAPKVPLGGMGGLPELCSVSVGAIGIAIWTLLSPHHIIRIRVAKHWLPGLLLVVFGFYALLVSIMSLNPVSIAYATQYLVYLLFGYLLLTGYLVRAVHLGQLDSSLKIIGVIGFIFAAGVIVSVWTGPIYPHQVLWYARQWGGLYIQQGVGFAEGTNSAGAILIVLSSFFWFACRKDTKASSVPAIVAVLALLMTISRGAIAGFMIGLIALFGVLFLRMLLRGMISCGSLRFAVCLVFVLVLLMAWISALISSDTHGVARAIASGFGIGGLGVVQDEVSRLELWQSGLSAWAGGGLHKQLFGKGFRNSMVVGHYGAWLTPHNLYIGMLGDFGLFGLVLFLAPFVFFVIGACMQILRSGGSDMERTSFVAIVGLLAQNMTETFFYSPILISLALLMLLLPVASEVAAKGPKK